MVAARSRLVGGYEIEYSATEASDTFRFGLPAGVLRQRTLRELYVSGNPGCLVQVTAAMRRAARPTPAFHPIELVDASIRGVAAGQLLEKSRR